MIAEGSPDVTIGGMAAARLLDKHVCPLHGPGPVTQTSMTVFINKVGAARVGDACTCMMPSTAMGGGNAKKEDQPFWEAKADGSGTKENKYATEGEHTAKSLREAWDGAKDKAGDKAIDQVVNGRDPKENSSGSRRSRSAPTTTSGRRARSPRAPTANPPRTTRTGSPDRRRLRSGQTPSSRAFAT